MSQNPEPLAFFKPLPWQIAPWKDTSPVMLLTGSAGGGKSRIAAEKVHGFCLRYPRATALVLRKAYSYAAKSILPFLNQTVIGNDPRVTYGKMARSFSYDNESVIFAGGMKDESQREAIRSMGGEGRVDIIWMEEANAFAREDLDECLARMRGVAAPWVQVILTTNPDYPQHWINQDLIIGGEAKVYKSGAVDNPHNPVLYLDMLNRLTGVLGQRLRDGLWIRAEGAVYDFDAAIHLINSFKIPSHWRRFRVVDFGYTNPLCCQWYALDHDDRMYLYREIYMSQRLVEDHARDIVRLSKGERIETTICDHDAEDRATLERYGVPTEAAFKAISVGIQGVQARLKVAGDGEPRFFIFRGALVELDTRLEDAKKPTCTEQEFASYVWPKTRDGQVVKEVPVKSNDHGVDGVRYATAYVDDLAQRPQLRPMRPMR